MSATSLSDRLAATSLHTSSTSSFQDSLRKHQTGILKTPLCDPSPSAKIIPRPALTVAETSKYEQLFDIVSEWTNIRSVNVGDGPVTDDERMWLSRECLLRYLRATKWDVVAAGKRLMDTLCWRRDYLSGWGADHVSPENTTGKQVLLGYDFSGRPVLYLTPGRQNTETSPRQNQQLIYMIERAHDMMLPHQETLVLLIDFSTPKGKKTQVPPMGQGKELLGIIQNHYPERLGRACIVNVPWLVNGFFRLIMPFVDPNTREKIKFNEDMRLHIPAEQLWSEGYKGDLNFEYDHSIYWPSLTKLCEERRAEKKARWEAAGSKLGESEAYIFGEGPIAVAPTPSTTTAVTEIPASTTPVHASHAAVNKNPSHPVSQPQVVILSAEKFGHAGDDDDDDVFEDAPEAFHVPSHGAVSAH